MSVNGGKHTADLVNYKVSAHTPETRYNVTNKCPIREFPFSQFHVFFIASSSQRENYRSCFTHLGSIVLYYAPDKMPFMSWNKAQIWVRTTVKY